MFDGVTDPDSPTGLLAAARAARCEAHLAEARLMQLAVVWAAQHSTDSLDEAATFSVRPFGDTGVPIAGPGAPWIAELCVAESAAAVGLPTEVGQRYLGEAVELAHRLPRLWRRWPTGSGRPRWIAWCWRR